jgi:hypothetical protein
MALRQRAAALRRRSPLAASLSPPPAARMHLGSSDLIQRSRSDLTRVNLVK